MSSIGEILDMGIAPGLALFFLLLGNHENIAKEIDNIKELFKSGALKDSWRERGDHWYHIITFILSFALILLGVATLIASLIESHKSKSYMLEKKRFFDYFLSMDWYTVIAALLSAVLILITLVRDFFHTKIFWKIIYIMSLITVIGDTIISHSDTPNIYNNAVYALVYDWIGLPNNAMLSGFISDLICNVILYMPFIIIMIFLFRLVFGFTDSEMYRGIVMYYGVFPSLFTFIKYPLAIVGMILDFLLIRFLMGFLIPFFENWNYGSENGGSDT